ncbi:MAG TPA: protein tyrosine phosphatase [Aliiroseovarius sp.]|nr:protein tyrosine phosphatase [Aliiroseovarius sp.]
MPGFFKNLHPKAEAWQLRYNSSFGDDISTPRARKQARWHTHVVDHAFLRRIWHNTAQLSPDAWRGNQPDPKRIAQLKQMGIRTLLNLRGPSAFAVYLFEEEACAEHGLALVDHSIDAYALSSREAYLRLFELFDTVEKPFYMHCKSGADRSGLAAAFYLLDQQNAPIARAMGELSLKYVHRKRSKAGILDHLLETYAADTQAAPMPIRQWIATRYDPVAITADFEESRARRGRKPA